MTLFLLAGIRSLFQLPYYLLIVAGLLVACRRQWRMIAGAALIPGLLIVALYAKNLALFGRFTTSTWLGMNYWGVISRNLSGPELEALAAQGRLSPLARIDRFAPLADYPAEYRRTAGYEKIPALQQVTKSTGAVNYNHLAYLAISDAYLRDALYVTVDAPRFFLAGVIKGWFHYFQSSSDYLFVEVNRARIAGINDLYDRLFYGKLPFDLAQIAALPLNPGGSRYVYLFLLIGLPFVVFYALRIVGGWKKVGALSTSQRALILYLCFNIAYVAFVGNLLEVGENNRFRFMTDPFSLALAGLFIENAVKPWLRKRSPTGIEASAGFSGQQRQPAKASTPEDCLNIYRSTGQAAPGQRICFITHSGYPVEPRARRMAEALAGHGYAVDVLCLQLPGQAAEEWVNGVRVLRLPEARHQGAGAAVYLREYVRFFGLAWRALAALHRRQPYALVQVFNPPDPLVFCTWPLKRRGVPVVLDLRELMPELFMSRFRLARGSFIVRLLMGLERRACAYADAVIVLHEPHRQIMLDRGAPAGKMTQVMNCPDERWFGVAPATGGVAVQPELQRRHPERSGASFCGAQSKDAIAAVAGAERPFVAIYHGAILERYGVDLLVQAAAQARNQIPGLRLELYGTGDFLPAVQALAAELGLGDAARFHGQRPLEEMRGAIAAADVGVTPMRQDVFTDCILPTKLLEYVAVGIPAIAAATATTAAYFDETTVQLFRPGDVADLAAKLLAVYRDPVAAARQAERARAFTARHNWQGERERYLALVTGVVRSA